MGFPAACSEMPRLLLNLYFLLDHLRRISSWLLRRISSWLLRLVGAGIDDHLSFDYDYSDTSHFPDQHHHQEQQYQHYHDLEELEEHSPAMRFDALPSDGNDGAPLLPEACAVCLGDFHGAAWVRRPRGCRHVFHRGCLDRWAAHGHLTCPLCRAPLLPSPPATPILLPLPLPAS